MTRMTVGSDDLELMIATIVKDTEEFIGVEGQVGARARAIRFLYEALIRWLASEVDLLSSPETVALAFADCAGILIATVVQNVVEASSESSNLGFNDVMQHIQKVGYAIIKEGEFEYTPLKEAGES